MAKRRTLRRKIEELEHQITILTNNRERLSAALTFYRRLQAVSYRTRCIFSREWFDTHTEEARLEVVRHLLHEFTVKKITFAHLMTWETRPVNHCDFIQAGDDFGDEKIALIGTLKIVEPTEEPYYD